MVWYLLSDEARNFRFLPRLLVKIFEILIIQEANARMGTGGELVIKFSPLHNPF